MNDFELQHQPVDAQLREALDGVARVFKALLDRSAEYGNEIAQARARHQAESNRLVTLERRQTADQAALGQLSAVFAEVAGRMDTAPAPAREVTPPPPIEAPLPAATLSESDKELLGTGAYSEVKQPAPLTGERYSTLTAADLLSASRRGAQQMLVDDD
jgi:hypothetical protein